MVKRPAWLPACPPPKDQPASLGERCKEPEARPIAFSLVMLLLACLSVSAHLLSHTCAALEEKVLSVFLFSLDILSYALRHGTEAIRLKGSPDNCFFLPKIEPSELPFFPLPERWQKSSVCSGEEWRKAYVACFDPKGPCRFWTYSCTKKQKCRRWRKNKGEKVQEKRFF